jgi:hypothetical protein
MASANITPSRPGDQGPSHGGGPPAPWWPLVASIMPIRTEARSMARTLHAGLAQASPVRSQHGPGRPGGGGPVWLRCLLVAWGLAWLTASAARASSG